MKLKVRNGDDQESVVRLLFAKDDGFAGVTGLTPMIRDLDGFPTGLAVQISKNWHQTAGRRCCIKARGSMDSLCCGCPRNQRSSWSLPSRTRWGGVPAASHAQLCLIGWGTNQRWDQAAIGSWGESICYDPDICLNRSMIDDVRPLMVWGMNQSKAKWTWTNNVGGGDFLVYVDSSGKRQYLTRMRAWYANHGPNLTDVTYAGVSADGAIAARLNVLTPRGDDINRAIHRIRYDVLKRASFGAWRSTRSAPTTTTTTSSPRSREEMPTAWPRSGSRRKEGADIPVAGSPATAKPPGSPSTARSIETRKRGRGRTAAWSSGSGARLGGQIVNTPTAAVFGTENGPPSANLELTPPPGMTELQPGDFVEAVLELVIMPVSAEDYYGPNAALRAALRTGGNTWKMILREAAGNSFTVEAVHGRVVNAWPLVIAVDARDNAEIVVNGGLGYVPVTFGGLSSYRGYELWRDDGQGPRCVDQAIHGRDFWQTDFDPTFRTWSLTYNVPVDTEDDRPGRVRLELRKAE